MSRAILSAVLAAALACAVAPAAAATYQGHGVDGRTWHCNAQTNDFGKFTNCEVRFDGERAYLTLPGGPRIILILEDEHIVDRHVVPAYDHRRGIHWELDVLDLGGR
jgi:hypothetical protein